MLTKISSSGNRVMKLEYARLATSTPPASSPYFFITPKTNAAGVNRCCTRSAHRITRSIGFITHPILPCLTCPALGGPNPRGAGPPGSDRVGLVGHVGDEHVPGRVGDRERRPGAGQRHLRGDAAGPEHRHVAVLAVHRVAEIRSRQVGYAQ